MNGFEADRVLKATAVLCIALLSFFVACDEDGDSSDQEARAEITSELFSFIPAGEYIALGYSDIDSLMQSDWARQIIELIPALELWDEKLGVSVDSFHNIAMAFRPPDEETQEEEGLILMDSELTAEDIFEMLGDRSRFFTEEKIAGRVLYQSGKDFGFGFVSDTVVALGAPALVEKALLLAEGKGKSIAKTDALDSYRAYFGSSDNIWMGFDGIDKYLGRAAAEVKMLRNFTRIQFVYFGMSAGDDISSRLILECDTEESAGKIARGLSGLLGVVGTLVDMQDLEVDVSEYGIQISELKSMIDEFLGTIDITSDENKVVISFAVPNRMIDFLIDSAREAMQHATGQGAVPDDLDDGLEDWLQ